MSISPSQLILVTGGAGFIGSHTVELLLQNGYRVRVLDNLFSGKSENLDLSHPNLEFMEGDILEFPLLLDLLADCDAVLHLAAIASVPFSIENPIYSFQVNTQGMLHILEAIRQTKRPIRLVYASSAAVYGDSTDLPCRDDQPLTGAVLSPYALQKKQMEEEAALYEKLHRIPSLGLRYFNVYGPRQDPASSYAGVISLFYQSYQEDKELLVYGDGLQSRDFISVKEVARANLLALQSDYHGVLNIATGQPQTLLQLISYIEATGNHSAKVRFLPARPGDILHSFGAAEKTAACLGFSSQQSLAAGIKDLIG